MTRWWILALVTSCGRLGFDPLPAPDACTFGAFGPAQSLGMPINSAGLDLRPSLTPDQLTLLFASDRDGTVDLFQATRASVDEPFANVTKLVALSSPMGDDTDPAVTADGLTLYFASTRNVTRSQLFRSMRSSPSDAWGAPMLVTELAEIEVYAPIVSSDGSELLFCQMNPTFQILRATFSGGQFAVGNAVTELGAACAPALSADDKTLFWEAHPTGASLQIYTATRTAIGAPWTDAAPLPGFADPTFDQGDPWPSRDGTTLFLFTNQTGNYDLYTTTRSCM
jgi:WD40-like Beta Propeller Repeat